MAELVASTPVAIESDPTSGSDLWGLSRLFIMSWIEGFQLSTTWITNIEVAQSGAEKRVSVTGKPDRIATVTILAMKNRESWLILNHIRRMGRCRSYLPIYSDFSKLTSAVSTSATVLPCDTTTRRLFAGQTIAIAYPSRSTEYVTFELATILSLTITAITLTAGVSQGYPINARIFPLMEVDVMINGQWDMLTGRQIRAQIVAKETMGPSALPPLAHPGDSTAYATFGGYPIFYERPQWDTISEGYQGLANIVQSGISTLFEIIGPRSRFLMARNFQYLTRASFWKVLTFFDLCSGRTFPFWGISSLAPWEIVSVSTTQIVVIAAGPLKDWEGISTIAVVQRSTNTPYLSAIASVTRASGNDTLTVSLPSIPSGDIREVCPAFLMRFTKDELVETWQSDQVVKTSAELVEEISESQFSIWPYIVSNTGRYSYDPMAVVDSTAVDGRWLLTGGTSYVVSGDPAWAPASLDSAFISWAADHHSDPAASSGSPILYHFTTSLFIPASTAIGTVVISCSVVADDTLSDIKINGTSAGLTLTGVGEANVTLLTFSPSLFVYGTNIVEFIVKDTGGLMGLDVAWVGAGQP
jgi:hypothetical protein